MKPKAKFIQQKRREYDKNFLATNIVYQIGDELFERGIITVKQRQETNDLFIAFTKKIINQAWDKSRQETIKEITEKVHGLLHWDSHLAGTYNATIMSVLKLLNKSLKDK